MAADPEPTQQPLWKITSIVDQPTFDPATGGGRVKRVLFRLYNGTTSYVDVPLSEFNPQKVGDLVHEHAQQLLDVAGIEAPTVVEAGYATS